LEENPKTCDSRVKKKDSKKMKGGSVKNKSWGEKETKYKCYWGITFVIFFFFSRFFLQIFFGKKIHQTGKDAERW